MSRKCLLGLLIAVFMLSSGCAYMRNRAKDAADIFSVDAGLGLGVGGSVMLTKYVAFNAGISNALKYGTSGRYAGKWYERIVGWPASWWYIFKSPGSPQDIGWCTGCVFSIFIHAWARESGQKKTPKLFELRYFICALTEEYGHKSPYRISPWDIGVSVHPVFFGTRIAFNPVEFADFMAGWFTVDFMNDDEDEVTDEEPPPAETDFIPGEEPEEGVPGD